MQLLAELLKVCIAAFHSLTDGGVSNSGTDTDIHNHLLSCGEWEKRKTKNLGPTQTNHGKTK
jgi:hypothetical protein